MKPCRSIPFGVALLALAAAAPAGAAAELLPQRREPLAASATLRVWRDTNLYLQDEAPVVAGTTAPVLPARENASALQAAFTVRETWRAGERLGVEAGYAAEQTRYAGHATEDHLDHTFTLAATARRGPWLAETSARYLYVDGSREAPTYGCVGGAPAIGGEPVRARREQESLRATARLTRRSEHGFARGVASWVANDFHTAHRNTAGYLNYTDRSEFLAGADAGRRAGSGAHLFAGVRVGRQRQDNVLGLAQNYTNSLVRALLGTEGTLGRTLKFSLSAGPDWRRYGSAVKTGFARRRQTSFLDLTASWTPTARDAFSLTARRQLWLGSGGRSAYVDAMVEAGWKRKLDADWTLGAGARFHEGDFTRYTTLRRDRITTATLSLGRRIGEAWRANFELLHDWSDSLVPNAPAREYSRWLPAVGATRSW